MTWVWAESTIPLIPAIPVEHGGVCRGVHGAEHAGKDRGQFPLHKVFRTLEALEILPHDLPPLHHPPSCWIQVKIFSRLERLAVEGWRPVLKYYRSSFSHLIPRPATKRGTYGLLAAPMGSQVHLWVPGGTYGVVVAAYGLVLMNGKLCMCLYIPCQWSGSWSTRAYVTVYSLDLKHSS